MAPKWEWVGHGKDEKLRGSLNGFPTWWIQVEGRKWVARDGFGYVSKSAETLADLKDELCALLNTSSSTSPSKKS